MTVQVVHNCSLETVYGLQVVGRPVIRHTRKSKRTKILLRDGVKSMKN